MPSTAEQWHEKLAPLLSVLDSIRPDAAERLRDVIDHNPLALSGLGIKFAGPADMLISCLYWKNCGREEYWAEVHYDVASYELKWFGEASYTLQQP